MSSIVLNQKQIKQTLAAKKTKSRETIKNTLVSPYDVTYWPQIPDNYADVIKLTLEAALPRIVPQKVKVPWEKIKHILKDERKKFRASLSETISNDNKSIVLGINDVTRLLEKNEAACVLITGDVQPKFMVQHLLDLAVLYKVPILVVPKLRDILKAVCGVGSTTLGLPKLLEHDELKEVLKMVSETHEVLFPFPEKHINFQRSQQPVVEVAEELEIEKKIVSPKVVEVFHLKRRSDNRRTFVPPISASTDNQPKVDRMATDAAGFIAFSSNITGTQEIQQSKKYKSLVVKRLKGNPNRQNQKKKAIKSKKRKL